MLLKYLFGAFISLPLLPIMYVQAKMIRARVPKLPEAQEPEGIQNRQTDKTLRLVSIGESTVAGVGIETHDEGMTGTFAKELADRLELNVSWRVYAKSGYTAREVKENILPEIDEPSPDLILLGIGGNDAFVLNTPWTWIKEVKEIVMMLQQNYPHVPIAFLGMPPIKYFPAFTSVLQFVLGNLVDILGDRLALYVSKQENVYYYARRLTPEDWNERLGINKTAEELFSDGVHPAKLTYQVWGKDMLRYLMEETDLKDKLLKRKKTSAI